MTKKQRAAQSVLLLEKLYPGAQCSLENDGDPWRLLVMARLSAQCTDERVNIVSKKLFEVLPDARSMAAASQDTVEGLIRTCGLFRAKAKSIRESSAIICDKYDGRVPDTMDELLLLPGVGRKIANLLLGDVFHKGGIVADTHCIRICGRLGFYPEDDKNPMKTEKIMTPLIDTNNQSDFCHRLVQFGREICTARNPACDKCPLADICLHNIKSIHKKHNIKEN